MLTLLHMCYWYTLIPLGNYNPCLMHQPSPPQVCLTSIFILSLLQVESDETRHRPRNKVVWMKDGEIIVTSGNRKYRNYGKKKKLLIRDPREEDSGIYECALSINSTEKGRAELWSEYYGVIAYNCYAFHSCYDYIR